MQKRYITIIVTVYNIAPYLDRFFQNLKAQTFSDYEALIIDDGSADDSLGICEKYAAEDDRIRVIALEHVGISQARNIALENIRTPFVTSLDGDDYFDNDCLKHLVDAQKKYDADMVLSNVIFRSEALEETSRFVPRAAAVYEGERIKEELPGLLVENRLNYLYGKLYRAELLSGVRVEPDVMQGSDTMINCQYVVKAKRIAVTEDFDYSYIRYQSRSVTSYKGDLYFIRLVRINKYLRDLMREHDLYTEEMERAIDIRIVLSAKRALARLAGVKLSKRKKHEKAREIAENSEFVSSYERLSKYGTDLIGERTVAPDEAISYVDECTAVYRDKETEEKAEAMRGRYPDVIIRLYKKINRR